LKKLKSKASNESSGVTELFASNLSLNPSISSLNATESSEASGATDGIIKEQ